VGASHGNLLHVKNLGDQVTRCSAYVVDRLAVAKAEFDVMVKDGELCGNLPHVKNFGDQVTFMEIGIQATAR
jgi:hypothetical protein